MTLITSTRTSTPTSSGDRIRLLKFVALFGAGGTERQFVNLGVRLNRDRFDMTFGCLRRWGQLLGEVEGRGIPVTEYRIRRFHSLRGMRQHLRLARDMARRHTQIVHTYNFYANVFAVPAAYLAGVPVIIASIRDQGVYLSPLQQLVQRMVCRLADCILVNADSIKAWLIADGFDASRIVTIRNGLDPARFLAGRQPGTRESLGIPASARIVSLMARLDPMKGIDDLLEAAAMISPTHRDVWFLVVGEGYVGADGGVVRDDTYQHRLEAKARELGIADRVVFAGYRSDIPALLAETTLSIQPSHSEGLSNVLIEAMAAGVPVVATRVGGAAEAIDDGVTGILVPPRVPHMLADAMTTLLADEARAAAMGAAGRRAVAERFSIDRMVADTDALYRQLLAARGAQRRWFARRGTSEC